MKYDGTCWCKQTATFEEGRCSSSSFTHWCACRPGTKAPLMKVLTEANGARGESMVSQQQNRPYRASVPSQTPRDSTPHLVCVGWISFCQSFVSKPACCPNTEVTVDLKRFSWFLTPSSPTPALPFPFCPPSDSVHSSAWTRKVPQFEAAARTDDKRLEKKRYAAHQRRLL